MMPFPADPPTSVGISVYEYTRPLGVSLIVVDEMSYTPSSMICGAMNVPVLAVKMGLVIFWLKGFKLAMDARKPTMVYV